MATAIIVKRIKDIGDYLYERTLYEVITEDGQFFKIKPGGMEDDDAICLHGYIDTSLNDLAEIAEGCFMKESNFFKEVAKNFKCAKTIRIEYDGTSVLVNRNSSSADIIIKNFEKKQKLLAKAVYYVVGVQRFKKGVREFDGMCLVLATSEETAVRKVEKKLKSYSCVCIGKYNKKANTFLLSNAEYYIKFDDMYKIDD